MMPVKATAPFERLPPVHQGQRRRVLIAGGNGATVYVAERTAIAGAVAYRETHAAGNRANPPRLSGSVISRGLPNGSEVRGSLSRRKTASCALMDSPWDVTAS